MYRDHIKNFFDIWELCQENQILGLFLKNLNFYYSLIFEVIRLNSISNLILIKNVSKLDFPGQAPNYIPYPSHLYSQPDFIMLAGIFFFEVT